MIKKGECLAHKVFGDVDDNHLDYTMKEGRTVYKRGEKPTLLKDRVRLANEANEDKWERIKQACLDGQAISAADERNGGACIPRWRKEGETKRVRLAAKEQVADRIKEFYPWELKILKMLDEQQPDDIKIIWIVDNIGGKGKTTFAKYLATHKENAQLFRGGSYDAICFKVRVTSTIFLFDYARDSNDQVSYRGIEAVKNGKCVTSKYRGCNKVFPIPWVFVFASFFPIKEKMREDMWELWDLNKEKQG